MDWRPRRTSYRPSIRRTPPHDQHVSKFAGFSSSPASPARDVRLVGPLRRFPEDLVRPLRVRASRRTPPLDCVPAKWRQECRHAIGGMEARFGAPGRHVIASQALHV